MAADDATSIDYAVVSGSYESSTESKILGGRDTPRQRRGRFQVGHQDRRRSTIGMLNDPHPFKVVQVRSGGGPGEIGHAHRRLDEYANAYIARWFKQYLAQ